MPFAAVKNFRVTDHLAGPRSEPTIELGSALVVVAVVNLLASGASLSQEASAPSAISVLDGAGRGIGGAVVQVVRPPQAGAIRPDATVLTRKRTSTDGVAKGPLPSLRGMMIVVDHPRYERFVGTYTDGRPPRVIQLGPGRLLEGQVLSADGSEVSEVSVCVRWQDEAPPPADVVRRCTATSADGRFVVSGLSEFAEGEVVAEAEGLGRATASVAGNRLPGESLVLNLDVAQAAYDEVPTWAARSGSIRVQVLSATGASIDRFRMRVLVQRSRSHSIHQWDADQGESPVIVPIPGDFAQGDLLQVHFLAEDHLISEAYRIYPNPGGVTDLGVVYLNRGAVVAGRLFDASGAQPVAGCLLELVPAGSGTFLHRMRGKQHVTISGSEGDFLLGGLAEGRYYLRTECRTGPPTYRLIVLDGSEHTDLGEIWQPRPRRVWIRVRGTDSGAVQIRDRFREAETPLLTAVLQSLEWRSDDRDARSYAEINLAPGVYRVDLLGSANELLVSKEISVAPYGLADRVEVDVDYRQRTIRSVLTLGGRPVDGGHVRFERILGSRAGTGVLQINAMRGDSVTHTTMFRPGRGSVHQTAVGADGSFVVEGAPEEFLWMTWFASDDKKRISRIWPDQPLSRLELGGTALVAGEVRPMSGKGLGQVNVVLMGDLDLEVAATSTAENGHFALPPVPPGRYRLLANTGGVLANAEVILTADESRFQILEADDEEAGTVEVRLATPNAPLMGAWMHVLGPDETLAATRLVVEDGVFRSENVPAGELSIVWNHSGACVGADKVTLESGAWARLDRTLRLGRLLEVRCSERSCAGEPLSLIRLTTETGVKLAHHLTGALPGTTFSDDGRVGLGCVTPGAYDLSLWTDERRWEAEFEVEPGTEETPVVVRIRPSG